MTARQLVGSMKANRLDETRAAADYRLPVEAVREALAYVESNRDLLEAEAEIERLILKRGAWPVALSLYLDDCSNSDLLADLLRQAGRRRADGSRAE